MGMGAGGDYPWFERLLQELGHECGWAMGEDSGFGNAQAEDGSAGHGVDLAVVAGGALSQASASESGRAQCAAVAGASAQAGANAEAGEESVAGFGLGPGRAEEAEAVDDGGSCGTGTVGLLPYAAERRKQLLYALQRMEAEIAVLHTRVEVEEKKRPSAVRLMTHPGVGPVTALAMVVTVGPAQRFSSAKQVGIYFGLIPSEYSSGERQKLGRISKQGSAFQRFC